MKLTTLAAKFLRIGATGFGGPMALIGLMEQHLVEKSQAVTADELATGIALGQVLPGPVAVDCAAYLGYRLRGVAGTVVSVVALILPSFALMLVISPLYFNYGRTVPQVAAFFHGVGPAVVAVILAAAWRLSRRFIASWKSALVALLACAGVVWKVNPILVIALAGLVGILIGEGPKGGAKPAPSPEPSPAPELDVTAQPSDPQSVLQATSAPGPSGLSPSPRAERGCRSEATAGVRCRHDSTADHCPNSEQLQPDSPDDGSHAEEGPP